VALATSRLGEGTSGQNTLKNARTSLLFILRLFCIFDAISCLVLRGSQDYCVSFGPNQTN
jgi:hypothetical protein